MAFFPGNFYSPGGSFTPLFRLLDDFDNYSRLGTSARHSALPNWQPKFDFRETGEAYELHGELPGINKEGISIEFPEPQTLTVRGRSERSYKSGTPPAGLVESGTTDKAAITEGGEDASPGPGTSANEKFSVETQSDDKKPAEKAKYWLSERSVGEFSRIFNFPSAVDQDAVTANFKDGILNITVPKAKETGSRRIPIE